MPLGKEIIPSTGPTTGLGAASGTTMTLTTSACRPFAAIAYRRGPRCRAAVRWWTLSAGQPPIFASRSPTAATFCCTYCMPADGLAWLPGRRGADLRRTGPGCSDWPSPDSASPTSGSPAVSRCCTGDSRTSSPPPLTRSTAGDRSHHQRWGWQPAHRASAAAGLDRVNVRWTPSIRGTSPRSPAGPPSTKCSICSAVAAAGLAPVKVNAVPDPVSGL